MIIYFYRELEVKYSPSIYAMPKVERSSPVSSLVKGTHQASRRHAPSASHNIDQRKLKNIELS